MLKIFVETKWKPDDTLKKNIPDLIKKNKEAMMQVLNIKSL